VFTFLRVTHPFFFFRPSPCLPFGFRRLLACRFPLIRVGKDCLRKFRIRSFLHREPPRPTNELVDSIRGTRATRQTQKRLTAFFFYPLWSTFPRQHKQWKPFIPLFPIVGSFFLTLPVGTFPSFSIMADLTLKSPHENLPARITTR